MFVLILIGFLGGLVCGISPCILPVVPVIFAAGASGALDDDQPGPAGTDRFRPAPDLVMAGAGRAAAGPESGGAVGPGGEGPGSANAAGSTAGATLPGAPRRRRPFAVVGGLVLSFAVFTLTGTWLLSALHLPLDLLRWIGLVVLGVVGLGLIVPAVGDLLERPFARLSRGRQRTDAGGFVLGISLGLVFVPCAGPVLAAIDTVGADHRFNLSSIVLTVAFAAGVAVPLLIFAILGERLAERMRQIRARAVRTRQVIGAVLVITALAIGFNLTDGLQRAVPGYTNALQSHIESNASATRALDQVKGLVVNRSLSDCTPSNPTLQECGPAPEFAGIVDWLNTPGDRPLTIAGLRGKVVLVDFWTYSCINCQRSLPHVESWYKRYAQDGLVVVGVHTPEFAFEHVPSNVKGAAAQLGVRYPVAIDNNYATWNAYQNNYWPAEYLIDAHGDIRHIDYGEGGYSQTESFIRQLLVAAHPTLTLPGRTDVVDLTPQDPLTPESYLGYNYASRSAPYDQVVTPDSPTDYRLPSPLPLDEYAWGGTWTIGSEAGTAGKGATLELNYQASDVYLVLGGNGTVRVSVNGHLVRTVKVKGIPRLYQLVGPSAFGSGLLSLAVSPGVQAYDFTFG